MANGVEIELHYTGTEKGINWEQTITTNDPVRKVLKSPYPDTDPNHPGYGNKTEIDITGCSVPTSDIHTCTTSTTRTTKYTFDNLGEFVTAITNALTQTEHFTHNAAFGAIASHTDYNNQQTQWSFDAFGRQTQELRADQTMTNTSYNYCQGTNGGSDTICPSNGALSVDQTAYAKDGSTIIAPPARSYLDGLARSIAKDVQGFDGCWVRANTIYDTFGNVAKTAAAHFLSGGTGCTQQAAPWTVNTTIDAIGRATVVTFPNCGISSTNFNALTVTVIKTVFNPTNSACNGTQTTQTTTTVRNDEGQVSKVTDDASNSVTYTYDAFNDPLTVTYHSGDTITNTYDIRGRKKTSSDPDMGNWSYIFDSFGELYQQTTARSEQITLTYDLVGHLTLRSRAVGVW